MALRMFEVVGFGENQVDDRMLRDMQAKIYGNIQKHYGDLIVDSEDLERHDCMDFYDVEVGPDNVALIVKNMGSKYAGKVRIIGEINNVDSVVETLDLENLAEEIK